MPGDDKSQSCRHHSRPCWPVLKKMVDLTLEPGTLGIMVLPASTSLEISSKKIYTNASYVIDTVRSAINFKKFNQWIFNFSIIINSKILNT